MGTCTMYIDYNHFEGLLTLQPFEMMGTQF